MRTLPFRHIYDSPVARRIYFVYGDVFQYENINKPTMEEAVPGFFGNGNITFFEHISLMIRASACRNAEGRGRLSLQYGTRIGCRSPS
jgi:cholesterol oxidase